MSLTKSNTQVLRAARLQPGENLLNETYQGKVFQFEEDSKPGSHWIESKTEGVFECDFKSTQLTLQRHYKFDLSLESDTVIANKILERVFQSKHNENDTDEEWMNARLNGAVLQLDELRIDIDEFGTFLLCLYSATFKLFSSQILDNRYV